MSVRSLGCMWLLATLSIGTSASADTYKKIWARTPTETITSKKTMPELEWCISNAMSDFGPPTVSRGFKKISITIYGYENVYDSLMIEDQDDKRIVIFGKVQGSGLRDDIRSCTI